MRIQVLYTAGCEHCEKAIEAAHDAIHMAGIDVEPEAIEVASMEQARQLRVLGSPTVLVDGFDVEPSARSRTDFNLG
jgi:glutaredoxin